MKNKKNNKGEFTKILKVRNIPAGKNYQPGFIISGKYLQNLGFDLFDQVWISSPGNGMLNIQKI
jgi:hypothetical protein